MRAPASLRPIFLYRTDHTAVDQVSRSLSFSLILFGGRLCSEERDEGNHHCRSTEQGGAGTGVCEGGNTPVVNPCLCGCSWCSQCKDSACSSVSCNCSRVPCFVLVSKQVNDIGLLNTEHSRSCGWVRISKPHPCSLASHDSGGGIFGGSSKTPASDTVTRGSTGPLGGGTCEFTSCRGCDWENSSLC